MCDLTAPAVFDFWKTMAVNQFLLGDPPDDETGSADAMPNDRTDPTFGRLPEGMGGPLGQRPKLHSFAATATRLVQPLCSYPARPRCNSARIQKY
jgi:hypothetical protein